MPAAISSGQPDKNAGGYFVRLAEQDAGGYFVRMVQSLGRKGLV
jgi:hypothetical protein